MLALLSEALFLQSGLLLLLACATFVVFHLCVILREEPMLRNKYQAVHQQYCAVVPRWLPRILADRIGLAKFDF